MTAELPASAALDVYILDDASTDGTNEAIRSEFPRVHLMRSKGDLWWAGGMRVAYGAALAKGYDFYIWMNDDVEMKLDAIVTLLATYDALHAQDGREYIVSGAMMDRKLRRTSYGGFRLDNRLYPSSYKLVLPQDTAPTPIDLVNGNMLLISGAVAAMLGNIPPAYVHTLADWDYGLRAKKRGVGLLLAPGHVGYCDSNVPARRRWAGEKLTLRQRYRKMLHPLALPFRPRAAFLREHFPLLAPVLIFSPYMKMPVDHVLWSLGLKK